MNTIAQDLANLVQKDAAQARRGAKKMQSNTDELIKGIIEPALAIAVCPNATLNKLKETYGRLSRYQGKWNKLAMELEVFSASVFMSWAPEPNIDEVAQCHNSEEDTCQAIRHMYRTIINETREIAGRLVDASRRIQTALSKG